MSSLTHITQEEAEAIVKLPEESDASRLVVKQAPLPVGNGQFRILEDAAFDPILHPKVGTTEGAKEIKSRLQRKHVALIVDTEYRLLIPAIPMVDASGNKIDGQYRMLNAQLARHVYGTVSKTRFADLVSKNNIEIVDGTRRFATPSVLLLPPKTAESRATPAKSVAGVLGGTAASVGRISSSSSRPKNLCRADALDMLLQLEERSVAGMMRDTEALFQACQTGDTSRIVGAFLGPTDPLGGELALIPPSYILGADKQSAVPSLSAQQRDLLNNVVCNSPLHFQGKFTVQPGGRSDEIVVVESGQISALEKSASLPEPTPMPPPKTATAAASSSSAAAPSHKRKPSTTTLSEPAAAAASANCVDSKRVDHHADTREAVLQKLVALSSGPFSMAIHDAVYGNEPPRGSWSASIEGSGVVPVAAAAGEQISEMFHANDPARTQKLIAVLNDAREKGLDSMDAKNVQFFRELTVEKLLNEKVDPALKSPMSMRLVPIVACQFIAGLLHGFLSTDLREQTNAVAADLIAPVAAAANASAAEVAALTKTNAALELDLDSLRAELEASKKAVADLTAELEAAKSAAAAAPKENGLTAKWAADQDW